MRDFRIEIGRRVDGGGVYLTPADLLTHLHILGLSRSGKSMWLLLLIIILLKLRKPLLMIDPHGDLYRKILAWIVAMELKREIILFDPSYEARIVGFNPFQSYYADEGRKMTKAERLSQQLLRIFGMESSDQFGNIERLLRSLFFAILDLGLSICDLKYFIYWQYEDKRLALINRLSSELIKADLTDLYSTKAEFERKIASTRNKLQRFTHPQMRRIMGLKDNNINLDEIIENRQILLCNLQASETDLVGRENMRALGTLLISELWESFRKRTRPQEFYLICDEMQEFMTPDLAQILPQSAKYGLHCILAHQHPGQLSSSIEVAIKNAQTKVIFSTEETPKRQRYFTLRRADHTSIEAIAPKIKLWKPSQASVERYVEHATKDFLTPEEVDKRLSSIEGASVKPETEEVDPFE
jgi:type IV secretory pathway TraG/TraD family ATPase VirD4